MPNQRAIPTGRLIGHWTVVGWFEGPGDLRGSWSGPGQQLLPMQFVFLGGSRRHAGYVLPVMGNGLPGMGKQKGSGKGRQPKTPQRTHGMRLSEQDGAGAGDRSAKKAGSAQKVGPPCRPLRSTRLCPGGESDDGDGGWNSNVSGGPQRHRWRTGMGCFLWQLKRRRFPNEKPFY